MTESIQNDDPLLEKVEVAPGIYLSRALAEFWPDIIKTQKSFIEITAVPSESLTPRQSSFGYYPAIPKGFDYPKDIYENYMFPLAQINFAEVPATKNLPRSGYLQFYISEAEGGLYGADFDDMTAQDNFRVLFFEESEVQDPETDFSFLSEVISSYSTPLNKPHALSFRNAVDYMGVDEIAFEKNFSFKERLEAKYPALFESLEEELCEVDVFRGNGHRLGGYAHFTQTDPRMYDVENANLELLLQIDSDNEIMWGDAGIGNFFIATDDLAQKNFSRVMYNWDCG